MSGETVPRSLMAKVERARFRGGVNGVRVQRRERPSPIPGVPAAWTYEAQARTRGGIAVTGVGVTVPDAVRDMLARAGAARSSAAKANAVRHAERARLDAAVRQLADAGPVRDFAPRCSPDSPCESLSDLHVAVYGECFVEGAGVAS